MIRSQDIRERASEWQLRVNVVEKDYVLGWLLAALAAHPETSQQWVFKGGTCLKKCFFETYRFSEDLDFSLLPGAKYTAPELQMVLQEVADQASELSGITFASQTVSIRERRNKRGQGTFEASIEYRGPMSDPGGPRVRFDLTRQEPVLDGVRRRGVFHAYPDVLPADILVATYSIDELFAEKLRALTERTRPRDLYDVMFMLENHLDALNLGRSRELFREKCAVKQLAVPTSEQLLEIIRGAAELRSEWANMLAHQLPELPPLDAILARLDTLFAWLSRPEAVPVPMAVAVAARTDEELVAAAGLQYWGSGVRLEAVRFAGANRLMVEFTYNGERRLVEPYSLRRASTGNILLYAWEVSSGQIKAFNAAKIMDLRATTRPFTPRFRVEFTTGGPMAVPSVPQRAPRASSSAWPRAPRTTRSTGRRRSPRSGIVYVYQCPYCNKKFEHSRADSTLRAHKNAGGYGQCPGRTGYLVTTRYR
jgi:predicted nucleotidyltransferase component of viral defense system